MRRRQVSRRLCLRCDNRHGCRTAAPPCELLSPRARGVRERLLLGKQLMLRRGLLELCAGCGLKHRCWSEVAYGRALRAVGRTSARRAPAPSHD